MENIEKAKEFAEKYHKGQMYGELPYTEHLRQVYEVLKEFQSPTDQDSVESRRSFQALCNAAWLHDVVEDTEATIDVVSATFGFHVATIVFAVTDGEGRNRKERKSKTYAKIRCQGTEATALKLADRIANTRSCIATNSPLLKMYQKEHKVFREQIYSVAGRVDRMWEVLDDLLA